MEPWIFILVTLPIPCNSQYFAWAQHMGPSSQLLSRPTQLSKEGGWPNASYDSLVLWLVPLQTQLSHLVLKSVLITSIVKAGFTHVGENYMLLGHRVTALSGWITLQLGLWSYTARGASWEPQQRILFYRGIEFLSQAGLIHFQASSAYTFSGPLTMCLWAPCLAAPSHK